MTHWLLLLLPFTLLPFQSARADMKAVHDAMESRNPDGCPEYATLMSRDSYEIYRIHSWAVHFDYCCSQVFGDGNSDIVLRAAEHASCHILAEPWNPSCDNTREVLGEYYDERRGRYYDLPKALATLRGPSSHASQQAIRDAGHAKATEAIPLIVPYLTDGDRVTRTAAIVALGNMTKNTARDALRPLLSGDSYGASMAALALARMDDLESIPAILTAMRSASHADLPAFRLALRRMTARDEGESAEKWAASLAATPVEGRLEPAAVGDILAIEHAKHLLCDRPTYEDVVAHRAKVPPIPQPVEVRFHSLRKVLMQGASAVLLIGEGTARAKEASSEEVGAALVKFEVQIGRSLYTVNMKCHEALRRIQSPNTELRLSGFGYTELQDTKFGRSNIYRLSRLESCAVGGAEVSDGKQ